MQYSNKNSTDIQKPMHWHTLLTSYTTHCSQVTLTHFSQVTSKHCPQVTKTHCSHFTPTHCSQVILTHYDCPG